MYKRLLALIVFIPMLLIAWYARNNRQPSENTADTRVASSREDARPSSTSTTREERLPAERQRENEAPNDADEDHGSKYRGRHHNNTAATNQPGVFDFYLLNLSWSPEFCSTHPGKPECAAHPGFVLHGLWPENNDGSYPENCSDAPGPTDPSAFRDIYPDAGLLSHEWSTHGTCSGLSPDAFFTSARTALHAVTIPSSLASLTHQTSATPDDLLSQFSRANPAIPRESFALSCGNNFLTAVEVCLGHDLHAVACSNIRSCRANSVRIIPPGGSDH